MFSFIRIATVMVSLHISKTQISTEVQYEQALGLGMSEWNRKRDGCTLTLAETVGTDGEGNMVKRI